LAGGEPIALERLALMVSRPQREVRAALAELERYGVSSRDAEGRLFSRRMVRDTSRVATLKENGRRGGNPLLVNQTSPPLVNQTLKSAGAHAPSGVLVLSGSCSSSLALDSEAAGPPGSDRALLAARFETFWTAYPHKKAKKDAEKAFAKLNPGHELLAVLLDAVERHKTTRQWREGVYPHAATWLNGERWKDEIGPEPRVNGASVEPFRPSIPKFSDVAKAQGL
jgi:hypothetical protein